MSRWVRIDRRYNQPYRLTGYGLRAILKWAGLIVVWLALDRALDASHFSFLNLLTTGGLILYAAHCARRNRAARLGQSAYQPVAQPNAAQWKFNPPPDWPEPPLAWSPPPGWQPDPSWPPAPEGWQFWTPAAPVHGAVPVRGAVGERNSRVIPQDVKIAVSARDHAMCVQCGSTQDLHFDHKIPWSRGGANTVNNIQLLCGPCNLRKGADDIPFG